MKKFCAESKQNPCGIGFVWYNTSMAFQTRLLTALSDPDLSLRDVADRLSLPLDQLSLILTRPDLEAEVASLESLAATRVRLVATSLLPAAAQTVKVIVDDFNSGQSNCPRETALRAVRILLRLANFASGPVAPRPAAPRPERTVPAQPSFETPITSQPAYEPEPVPQSAGEPASSPDSQPQIVAPPQAESPRALLQNSEDQTSEDQSSDDLSDPDAIALAAQLLRQGAFTADQLGDVFRLAAAESGEDFDHLRFDSPEALATEFESIVASLKNTPDFQHAHPSPIQHASTPQPGSIASREPEYVPP